MILCGLHSEFGTGFAKLSPQRQQGLVPEFTGLSIQEEVQAMLVLTRKRSQTIQIGDEIVVKVIRTGKGAVKIGIEAPEQFRVLRGELLETVREEEIKL